MAATENTVPHHFLVIVPGYMGSKLRNRDTGEIVWVNTSSIPWNPLNWEDWLTNLLKTLEYPNDKLEPSGIMNDIIFIPPWAKLENYERLVSKLQSLNYRADIAQCFGYEGDQPPFDESKLNVYAFAYDWRQDNRLSARQLGAAIDRWRKYHPGAQVWIIAHSNGGLVARWYIEQEGGKDYVKRLFLMGSPWDGTPKALYMAFNGVDALFLRRFSVFNIPERTRKLVRTFPSIYQLIPHRNKFLRGMGNESVNPFSEGAWLDPAQTIMLQDGLAFSQQLGTSVSVETLCFFGTRHLTQTSGRVLLHATNSWKEIEWDQPADEGDGTIPTPSAVHPNANEKLPYPVSHGDIYVHEAVLEKLRFELVDKYRLVTERATIVTNNLKIVFEQESDSDAEGHRDFYSPGEKIKLWATVHRISTSDENMTPVSNASIKVDLLWRKALPGVNLTDAVPATNLHKVPLDRSLSVPGRYEGTIVAPQTEGYYEVKATISVMGLPPVSLSELIAIEAEPDLEQLHDEG